MKNQELVEILDEGFHNLCSVFEGCAEVNNCIVCDYKELCLKVWDGLCSTWNGHKAKTKREVLALVMSRVEKLVNRGRSSRPESTSRARGRGGNDTCEKMQGEELPEDNCG
ncbi:hypothetical protein M1O17_05340, partial [Dehalococcoidia bacterium]|nr:hypothetical protein [Dehalococcoidia bacterium]